MKTTHELGKELLALPNVPVVVEYWCSDNRQEPVPLMTEYDPEGTAMICQGQTNGHIAQEPKPRPTRWIRNIKEGHIHADGCGADAGGAGGICCTCGMEMSHGWDTVCKGCGDLMCYHHSFVNAERKWWFCSKCAPAGAINADSPEYTQP